MSLLQGTSETEEEEEKEEEDEGWERQNDS